MTKRIAIVTGGSQGIGLETARLLLEQGWNVALAARNESKLIAAKKNLNSKDVLAIPCDVANADDTKALVNRVVGEWGGVTAVVNNAGVIDPIGTLHELSTAEWIQLQNINVGGVMHMVHAVLPIMKEQQNGVIVNLSSGAAHNAVEGWSAYCTSKAAVNMFTKCVAAEYADDGIRIHDFIPGVVDTDMLNGAQEKFENAISRLDPGIKIPAILPAQCLAWVVQNGKDHDLAVELSIRDKNLRDLVGLQERDQW